MNILLLESDKHVRDQILVGLQNVPEFAVEVGEGYVGLNALRNRSFDCVFVPFEDEREEGLHLLEKLREFDHETDVVVVAPQSQAKSINSHRSRQKILAVLAVPIDPKEFFRLAARLRRKSESLDAQLR